jgi:hypothetical protein
MPPSTVLQALMVSARLPSAERLSISKRIAVSATVPKLRTTFANLFASLASERVSSSCNARFREVYLLRKCEKPERVALGRPFSIILDMRSSILPTIVLVMLSASSFIWLRSVMGQLPASFFASLPDSVSSKEPTMSDSISFSPVLIASGWIVNLASSAEGKGVEVAFHRLGSMGLMNVARKSVGVTNEPFLIAAECSADITIVFLLTTKK